MNNSPSPASGAGARSCASSPPDGRHPPAGETPTPRGVPSSTTEARSTSVGASSNHGNCLMQQGGATTTLPGSAVPSSHYIPVVATLGHFDVVTPNGNEQPALGLPPVASALPSDTVLPRRIGLPVQSRFTAIGAPLEAPLSGRPRLTTAPSAMPRASSLSGPSGPELPTTAAEEAGGSGSLLSLPYRAFKVSPPTSANEDQTSSSEEVEGSRFLPSPEEVAKNLFESLFFVQWAYKNEDELKQNYMETQEAARPRSAPSSWRKGVKKYCVSLYGWGWCVLPFRFSCSWLEQVGPSLLAGFFIPFSLVPTAMTCAVISGLPVSAALNSCWILCLISSLLGGAPGTVSAVTEAISTALVATVTEDCSGNECVYKGREFIFPAGILCGIVQCLCGLFGFGRYVSLVPAASKVGYVNAVAIINCRAQLHAFKYDPMTSTGYEWMLVLGLILEVCLIMHFWPMIAPWKLGYLPPSAVALAASVATEFLVVRRLSSMQTKTVGDVSLLAGGGNLPSWFLMSPAFQPPSSEMLSFRGLYTLIEVALTLVLLSSMSTVMTLEKIQEASKWTFKCDRQLVALGAANAVSSVLGCLPGTTGMMVSLLANRMGAQSKEGPLLAGVFLLVFTSAAYHVLDVIPLGGLSGAIIYTAASAVSWRTFPPLLAAFLPGSVRNKHPALQPRLSKTEAAVVLLTTVLGATFDLGSALLIGIFISLSSFAWSSLKRFSLESVTDPETDTKYYYINGPLFFSTVRQLAKEFHEETAPKRSIVVLHAAAAATDHAVLLVLREIVRKHEALGKEFIIYGINPRGALMGLYAGRAVERNDESSVLVEETLS